MNRAVAFGAPPRRFREEAHPGGMPAAPQFISTALQPLTGLRLGASRRTGQPSRPQCPRSGAAQRRSRSEVLPLFKAAGFPADNPPQPPDHEIPVKADSAAPRQPVPRPPQPPKSPSYHSTDARSEDPKYSLRRKPVPRGSISPPPENAAPTGQIPPPAARVNPTDSQSPPLVASHS
ncbi:MAG: hypothetical protein RLZZ399_744 [Verrucomicrobiota bacterium]